MDNNTISEIERQWKEYNEDAVLILIIHNSEMPAPEVIINEPLNVAYKIEYLKKAYTEELVLKSNSNICIGNFKLIPSKGKKEYNLKLLTK